MRIFNNPYDETPMKYHYFLVFFLLPLSILYYGNRSYLFWSLFIGFLSDIKLAAGYPELVYRVSIVYSMLLLCKLAEIGLLVRKNWGRTLLFLALATKITSLSYDWITFQIEFKFKWSLLIYILILIFSLVALLIISVLYYRKRKHIFLRSDSAARKQRAVAGLEGEEAEGDTAFFDASSMDLEAVTKANNEKNAAQHQNPD